MLSPLPDGLDGVLFSPNGERILETRSGLRFASEKADAPETKECRSAQFDAEGELVAKFPNGYVRFKVANGSLRRDEDVKIPRNLDELWVNAPDGEHPNRRRFVGPRCLLATAFDGEGAEFFDCLDRSRCSRFQWSGNGLRQAMTPER